MCCPWFGGGVRVVIKSHAPTRNWKEQVVSTVNGFPKAIAFHEQRLFFGGVTNIPDLVAGSKVGQFFNFDVGESVDADEPIVELETDKVNLEVPSPVTGLSLIHISEPTRLLSI